EPSIIRKELKTRSGAHVIEEDDEFDLNSFFADVEKNEAADRDDITPPDQPPVMPPPRSPTAPLPRLAPSQQSRPNPIAPGAAAAGADPAATAAPAASGVANAAAAAPRAAGRDAVSRQQAVARGPTGTGEAAARHDRCRRQRALREVHPGQAAGRRGDRP